MTNAETAPTSAKIRTGTSQFFAAGALAFTSSKTSPGETKMFVNRAARDDAGGGMIGGACSINRLFSTTAKLHENCRTPKKIRRTKVNLSADFVHARRMSQPPEVVQFQPAFPENARLQPVVPPACSFLLILRWPPHGGGNRRQAEWLGSAECRRRVCHRWRRRRC